MKYFYLKGDTDCSRGLYKYIANWFRVIFMKRLITYLCLNEIDVVNVSQTTKTDSYSYFLKV